MYECNIINIKDNEISLNFINQNILFYKKDIIEEGKLMNDNKLKKWADLLLDTGKRNNLINFKNTKYGTVEVVYPDIYTLFSKVEHSKTLEIYDSKISDEFDDDFDDQNEELEEEHLTKDDFIEKYSNKVKKCNQILIYNSSIEPSVSLQKISKKAKDMLEETGVNIAYMAFGFINWTESDSSNEIMHAPILLVPISIERETTIDPFEIKITDNDMILNPTFSFKLKNDYGIELAQFDEDESIESYFDAIEKAIEKLNWTISRECKIGTFSFLKINMYEDIMENSSKILENNCVRLLLGEDVKDSFSNEVDNNLPIELSNVVDADSSQEKAIELAHKGKSFVLQGPPGTGKSQTITNIISECLACGKKVLFVSEKLAALNVVYDKLKKAGLDEFCLELHSHKANKKDIIEELWHTINSDKKVLNPAAKKEIESKIFAQRQLDQYVNELHEIRPVINKSLYQLFEEVSLYRKLPDVDFLIKDIDHKREYYLTNAENKLNYFINYIPSIGADYHQNPWYGFTHFNYSYQEVSKLRTDLENVISMCENLEKLNDLFSEEFKIIVENVNQAYALDRFFKLTEKSNFITPLLLKETDFDEFINKCKQMYELSKIILDNKNKLDEVFDEDVYKLDGSLTYKKLTRQFSNFFSRLFSGEYRRILKELRLCKKDGKKLKYKFAASYMEFLSIYQEKLQEFMLIEKDIKDKLGKAYKGINTDFDILLSEVKELQSIYTFEIDFSFLANLSVNDYENKKEEFASASGLLNSKINIYKDSEEAICNKFDLSEYNVRTAKINLLHRKYKDCLDNIDNIDNWCEFVKLLSDLKDLELREFIDYLINNNFNVEKVTLLYKKAFYTQWAHYILHSSNVLQSLSRVKHDELVNTFMSKDAINFEINKVKIKEFLSAQRPNMDMIAQGSAVSILAREREKKRKQKPIRTLFSEIGDLVQTLKPCFLMSPLSVSTYLDKNIEFDVVVFDEASQIFPQDALGAIYRGKQLIVVGDSKQMPPSNFFNSMSMQDDTDEDDDISNFESILDICATVLPQKRLKWHYRSRYEQLIAFSNKNFYDNDLITFPSSKKDGSGTGVNYYYVDGVFDRKSRQNLVEAEKIVDLVFENIEKYPERSLGVVAFSISQQNLIDRLISKRRKKDPSKESFFKYDKNEPFFVKNLETVQGDERDTIIFSIAYGKDSQGRLLLNFGPLNREGGERRLNVAITRAKVNVQVVSSMHYADIDLTKAQSNGARLLREYLDYAENGTIALERSISVSKFDKYDSEFETEVCEFLRENGYSVDTQVGCSSFKIDLGLKVPNSSNYVLAIECDGASYHSSKNSRDRDRLRQEILENMGWKFYRIWSTDWFRNNKIEKKNLLDAVKKAIENINVKVNNKITLDEVFEENAEVKSFEFPKYEKVDEEILSVKYKRNAFRVIKEIVETEAPISEEWLLKRISFLFNREKVTSVVKDECNRLLKNCFGDKIIKRDGFIYKKDEAIPMLRVPQNKDVRDIKYIALEEIALGIKEVIKQNITVNKNGLFRLLAQQLGFSRLGDAIIERFEDSLKIIAKEIVVENDNISLKNR